ncbi:MAG TPA: hypothetical protein VFK14_08970 [Solirubrobacterales bacterium]|nr:hypothetical protein [Solirubrobacterales bacterium]
MDALKIRYRRHLEISLRCTLMATLAIGLVGLAAHPRSATAGPLVTGVTNIEEENRVGFAHTVAAGARFVRIPLVWVAIAPYREPAGWQPEDPLDPHYDWSQIDEAVTQAVAAGLTPVLQLDAAPPWVQGCAAPTFARAKTCEPSPDALAAFITAAARRYSGKVPGLPRVRYWQALNEPNLSIFFNPQFAGDAPVSPYIYRNLLNRFYAAVKAVDPSDLVLAAGLGPIAVPGFTIGPMRFARLLLCMQGHAHPRPMAGSCEGGAHFDIFAIQPYTTGGPTHEGGVNDVELGDLGKLQTLIAAADRAGRIHGAYRHTPLWITEFSWDSNPPDPGGLPMKVESAWVAEALYRAWRAGVSHFFWYSLRDSAREPGQSYAESLESGLYFRGAAVEQDQPKEFLTAFRFPFVSYPRRQGLFFWGRTPTSRKGKVAIQLLRGERWHTAARVRANGSGIFTGRLGSGYGRNRKGRARAVYHGQTSIAFSMRRVGDFRHPPFG